MRPGVIANFVAFPHCALHDFWMLHHVFTDDEKGRVNVMLRE